MRVNEIEKRIEEAMGAEVYGWSNHLLMLSQTHDPHEAAYYRKKIESGEDSFGKLHHLLTVEEPNRMEVKHKMLCLLAKEWPGKEPMVGLPSDLAREMADAQKAQAMARKIVAGAVIDGLEGHDFDMMQLYAKPCMSDAEWGKILDVIRVLATAS